MATEKTVVKALVSNILLAGYSISVNDGEDWVVRRSTDKKLIIGSLFSTDEDYLMIFDPRVLNATDKTRTVGSFHLVYGNSADEVIADYTDNAETERLYLTVAPITSA